MMINMQIEDYIVSTDQQLVNWVLKGDSTAFEYLFNRYRVSILQLYIQRTGGNEDDANDLLQETFVKAYLNLHKYDPKYTFGQWIFTIARNTFIDHIRKKRDDLSIDNLPLGNPMLSPVSVAPTPEESYINQQRKVQLEDYMLLMPERYRQLIDLRFYKEYSYEEIANELKLPLGTVKTQIHRARELLCKYIVDNKDF